VRQFLGRRSREGVPGSGVIPTGRSFAARAALRGSGIWRNNVAKFFLKRVDFAAIPNDVVAQNDNE
jgi:hypothetical protein